jgi:hypothetical protein
METTALATLLDFALQVFRLLASAGICEEDVHKVVTSAYAAKKSLDEQEAAAKAAEDAARP